MLLIILSALIYAISYILPLNFLILFFLLPLFYIAKSRQFNFLDGFIWGAIAFGLQEYGIFYSLIKMASGNNFIYFVIICLIIYQAILSGLWLWGSSKISEISKISLPIILVITTWAYFMFLEYFVLFVFGAIEGYPFANPLILLSQYPIILSLLPIITEPVFLFLFILKDYILLYKKAWDKYIYIFLAINICVNLTQTLQIQAPEWLKYVSHFPYAFDASKDPKTAVLKFQDKITEILKNKPETELILSPESSLFCCDLEKEKNLLDLLNKKINILVGGIRTDGNRTYNTIYHIYDGKIIEYHDKKHALLLTERIPHWAQNTKDIYLKNKPEITESDKNRAVFNIKLGSQELNFIPMICSEIFFNNKKPNMTSQYTIISLCNDTWISAKYVEKLMELMHRYRAIQWRTNIIYCAYNNYLYIDKVGNIPK